MRLMRVFILLPLFLLSACAGTQPRGLFQSVREIRSDGKISPPLADKDLSPFLQLLRHDFPAPAHASTLWGQTTKDQQPAQIFALEVDAPEGEGSEGGYLAIVRAGQSFELRYHEQSDHQPRSDRYYHRALSDEERAAFETLLQAHPLAQWRLSTPPPPTPAATMPEAAPDGQPTTPASVESADAGTPEGDSEVESGFQFRLTDARPGQALTLVLAGPAAITPPAAEMIALLRQMKNAGGFACTYVRSIPLTARPLFADPQRQVLAVWNVGDDLRIGVTAVSPEGSAEWLAFREGRWEASVEPGTEPTTAPALEDPTAATTQVGNGEVTTAATATAPAATMPAGNDSGILPTEERWWTQPQTNATVVMHYVPLSPTHGVTHGFVVPGLLFDDEHCAVNAQRGLLYVIHDGQLLSLEVPAEARQ